MSDRVRFTTNRPAVDADAYGFSGFPFRVYENGETTGTGTLYPIPLPREARDSLNASCARWYHRGKILSLSTDLEWTKAAVTTTITNGALTPSGVFPTREQHLIDGAHTVKDFDVAPLGLVRLFAGFGITKDGANYYPYLLITIDDGDFAVYSLNDGMSTGNITATLDGEDFTLYYKDNGVDSFTFTSFDLTWSEFWPYDDGLGNPVYDTATGLEI